MQEISCGGCTLVSGGRGSIYEFSGRSGLAGQSYLHQYFLEAFDLRNLGDYGAVHAIDEANARQVLENAQTFCATIRSYLTPA